MYRSRCISDKSNLRREKGAMVALLGLDILIRVLVVKGHGK